MDTFLHGQKEICVFLNCTPRRLKLFVRHKAPVRVIGRGRGRRYVAESMTLLKWVTCYPAPDVE